MLRCANLCALGQSKQRADVGAIQYSIHNAFISAICSTDYGTFVIAYTPKSSVQCLESLHL